MIGFLLKFLAVIALVGGVGLVGYAYLADLTPPQRDIVQPIVLDVD